MSELPPDLKWMLATRRYSMFMPGNREDLLVEYPELQDIPSFNALKGKPKELLFVWYYACKASPAMELNSHGERVEFALESVYKGKPPAEVIQRYKDKRWSPEIARAIPDMQGFELGVRVKQRLMVEFTLNNLLKIINVNVDELLTMEEKKEYADFAEKAMKVIANITQKAEGNYGVKEIAIEDESPGAVRERSQPLVRQY